MPERASRSAEAAPLPSRSFQRSWLEHAVARCGFGALLAAASVPDDGKPRLWAQNDVISEINVTGNRRIPAETIRARIFTKPGDIYDAAALERDFNSLWNTGYFEDIKFLREQTPKGWRIIVQVKEKPTIREIQLRRTEFGLEQRRARSLQAGQRSGLWSRASTIPRASRKPKSRSKGCCRSTDGSSPLSGRKCGRFLPLRWASRLSSKKGRRSKSARSSSRATRHIKSRILRAAMKNLKPIGIPHSIFLENIFAKTYDATKLEEDTERVRAEYQNRGYFKARA